MRDKTKLKYIAKMIFKYFMAITGFIVVWCLFCAFIENVNISKCYVMNYGLIAYFVSDLVYRSTKTMIQNRLKITEGE